MRTKNQLVKEVEKLPKEYERPQIKRHAVIMTMAPQGSKMGHGLFPFAKRNSEYNVAKNYSSQGHPYRRG